MVVCLSPNGESVTSGDGAATEVLVATVRGLWCLSRPAPGGAFRVGPPALEEHHVSALLVEPAAGLELAATYDAGLFASTDHGATWQRRSNGLAETNVYSLAARREGRAVQLLAGTEPVGLYRSFDFGESWSELPSLRHVPGTESWTFPAPPHLAHVKWVALHPDRPRTLYAAVEQGGLYRSDDDGASWSDLRSYETAERGSSRDIHRVVLGRDPRILYMATGEGAFRSSDGGASFEFLDGPTRWIGYPDFVFVDPSDDRTVYLGGALRGPGTWENPSARPAFLRSRDGGDTWEELMEGLPDPVAGSVEAMSMHIWPGGPSFYAATTAGQVFGMEGEAGGWALLAEDLPAVSKVGHYRRFLAGAASSPS
jgi:photosystem II stability/assembly factor-like uncharacterized protein